MKSLALAALRAWRWPHPARFYLVWGAVAIAVGLLVRGPHAHAVAGLLLSIGGFAAGVCAATFVVMSCHGGRGDLGPRSLFMRSAGVVLATILTAVVGSLSLQKRLDDALGWIEAQAVVIDGYVATHGRPPESLSDVVDVSEAPAHLRDFGVSYHVASPAYRLSFPDADGFHHAWISTDREWRTWWSGPLRERGRAGLVLTICVFGLGAAIGAVMAVRRHEAFEIASERTFEPRS